MVDLAENNTIWREPSSETRQQPDQNNGSSQLTVNMNSRKNTTQQKTEPRDLVTGSQVRDKLRDLAAKRRRASNNNNGEGTQTNQDTANRNVCKRSYVPPEEADPASKLVEEEVNEEPAIASASPGKCPLEPTRQPMVGDVNRSIYEKSASNQLTPEQGQPKENPSPTTTKPTPNRRRVTRRSREYYAGGDLITIYESEDEAKFEQSPTNIQTPHRRQADNGDPGITPPVRPRLVLDVMQ